MTFGSLFAGIGGFDADGGEIGGRAFVEGFGAAEQVEEVGVVGGEGGRDASMILMSPGGLSWRAERAARWSFGESAMNCSGAA